MARAFAEKQPNPSHFMFVSTKVYKGYEIIAYMLLINILLVYLNVSAYLQQHSKHFRIATSITVISANGRYRELLKPLSASV